MTEYDVIPDPQGQPKRPDGPVDLTPEEFEDRVGKSFGIPRELRKAMTGQESGGRQYRANGSVVTSPKQAKGRYQVLQSTADTHFGKGKYNVDDEYDNIYVGLKYLKKQFDSVDSKISDPVARWKAAIAGYHGGESQIRHINRTGGEIANRSDGGITTPNHVDAVMQRWQAASRAQSGDGDLQQGEIPGRNDPTPTRPERINRNLGPVRPVREKTPSPASPPAAPFDFRAPVLPGQGRLQATPARPRINVAAARAQARSFTAPPAATPDDFQAELAARRQEKERQGQAYIAQQQARAEGHQRNNPMPARVADAAARFNRTALQAASAPIELAAASQSTDFGEEAARKTLLLPQLERALDEYLPVDPTKQRTINPLDPDFYSVTVPEVLGNVAPMVATGGLLGAAGVPALAARLGATGMGMAQSGGQGYREARATGANRETAQQHAGAEGAIALTEMLGGRAALGQAVRPGVRRVAADIAKDVAQEGAQQVLSNQNAIRYSGIDPERGAFKDVPESMVGGLLVSGGMNAANAGAQGLTRTSREEAAIRAERAMQRPARQSPTQVVPANAPLPPRPVAPSDAGTTAQPSGIQFSSGTALPTGWRRGKLQVDGGQENFIWDSAKYANVGEANRAATQAYGAQKQSAKVPANQKAAPSAQRVQVFEQDQQPDTATPGYILGEIEVDGEVFRYQRPRSIEPKLAKKMAVEQARGMRSAPSVAPVAEVPAPQRPATPEVLQTGSPARSTATAQVSEVLPPETQSAQQPRSLDLADDGVARSTDSYLTRMKENPSADRWTQVVTEWAQDLPDPRAFSDQSKYRNSIITGIRSHMEGDAGVGRIPTNLGYDLQAWIDAADYWRDYQETSPRIAKSSGEYRSPQEAATQPAATPPQASARVETPAAPSIDPVARRAAEREAVGKGTFGRFQEAAHKSAGGARTPLVNHPELRSLLGVSNNATPQDVMNRLAELGDKPRSSHLSPEDLRGVYRRLQIEASRRGSPISDDLRKSFTGTAGDFIDKLDATQNFLADDDVADIILRVHNGEQLTRQDGKALADRTRAIAEQYGLSASFAGNWVRQLQAEAEAGADARRERNATRASIPSQSPARGRDVPGRDAEALAATGTEGVQRPVTAPSRRSDNPPARESAANATETVAPAKQSAPEPAPSPATLDADTIERVIRDAGGEVGRANLLRDANMGRGRLNPALELLKQQGRVTEENGKVRAIEKAEPEVKPESPRTVTHDNPAINGKEVIRETEDGRVIVANPDNRTGISVVKDQGETATTDKAEQQAPKASVLGKRNPEAGAVRIPRPSPPPTPPRVSADVDVDALIESNDKVVAKLGWKAGGLRARLGVKAKSATELQNEYETLVAKLQDAVARDDGAALVGAEGELHDFMRRNLDHSKEGGKVWRGIETGLALQRGLVLMGDFNWLRNVGNVAGRNPGQALGVIPRGIRAMSEGGYNKAVAELRNRPGYATWKATGELGVVTDIRANYERNPLLMDDTMMGHAADVLPLFKHIERNNAVMLDNAKLTVVETLTKRRPGAKTKINPLSKARVAQLEKDGYTPAEIRDQAWDTQVVKFANAITGRGNLKPGGKLKAASMALTSARYLASYPDSFYQGIKLIAMSGGDKAVAGNVGAYLLVRAMMTAAVSAAATGLIGEDDDEFNWTDPRRADWLNIKRGDRRLDLGGGGTSYMRTMAQMLQTVTDSERPRLARVEQFIDLAKDFMLGRAAPGVRAGAAGVSLGLELLSDDADIVQRSGNRTSPWTWTRWGQEAAALLAESFSAIGIQQGSTAGVKHGVGEGLLTAATNTLGLSLSRTDDTLRRPLPTLTTDTPIQREMRRLAIPEVGSWGETMPMRMLDVKFNPQPLRSMRKIGEYQERPVADKVFGRAAPAQEDNASFERRLAQADQLWRTEGNKLVQSEKYQKLPKELQKRAVLTLRTRITAATTEVRPPRINADEIVNSLIRSEQTAPRREQAKERKLRPELRNLR